MLFFFIGNVLYWLVALAPPFLTMLVLEAFWGREEIIVRDQVASLPFWAAQIIARAGTAVCYYSLVRWLGLKPIFHVPSMNPILGSALLILTYDFGFYLWHRAQHAFLWRWHAPHHSFRTLSVMNSYHHWTDPILSTLLLTFPMSLVEWPPSQLPLVAAFISFQAYALHSDLKVGIGPLTKVIVGPDYHRLHHSLEPRHFDKNFGTFIPLWDWLFGTLVWPEPGYSPAVGVAGEREPGDRDWWLAPFRRSARENLAAAGGSSKRSRRPLAADERIGLIRHARHFTLRNKPVPESESNQACS